MESKYPVGKPLPKKPQVLDALDIPSIAKYIKSDKCRDIFFMVGAGISTSAGIPDFRSPETGLYANLARLRLPYPEAVFDIRYFRENPQPFYTLAAELYPGSYRPTVTHAFIRLLAEKKKLHTCFTQNIDTLERIAGVPLEHIFEAHGSFATQRCIRCQMKYPDSLMEEHVRRADVPHCVNEVCDGLVKPDIVFFGEGLPENFGDAIEYLSYADLLIIMGTSLTVYPFAGLRQLVEHSCPRVLINLDQVGDIGSRADDVFIQMACDDAVRLICDEIGDGWREELERLWDETKDSYTPREPPATSAPAPGEKPLPGKLPKNPGLEDEVARLAKVLGERMKVSDDASDDEEDQERSAEVDPDVSIQAVNQDDKDDSPVEEQGDEEDIKPTAMPHYEKGELSVPETHPVPEPKSEAGSKASAEDSKA